MEMLLISSSKRPTDGGWMSIKRDKKYYVIDINTGSIKQYLGKTIIRNINNDKESGNMCRYINASELCCYWKMSIKYAKDNIDKIMQRREKEKRSATIEYGEKKTVGDVIITWCFKGDDLIISVGDKEIPITFELEDSPLSEYGVGCTREMMEMEAVEEYTAHIGDCTFRGINKNTIDVIEIRDFQETDDTTSFKLGFRGSYVVRPGDWTVVFGKVILQNGNITVEGAGLKINMCYPK